MVNQTAAASPRFSTTLSPVSDPLISVRGLTKVYGQVDTERAVTALDRVDVDFPRAQFTAIMGPSGSGKSSLLHILAGLDTFQSGTVKVAGRDLSQLNTAELTRFRRDTIGFIFQAFNLVPTLTVAENIELSAMVRHLPPDRRRFKTLIRELDLESRLSAFPSELSGGQQQKVACARALLTAPEVVFADEPTGNLDSASSAQVLSFLRAAARDWEQSVIMVTHEPDAAKYADRVLFLFDGQIVAQLTNPTREAILEAEQALGESRQARKRAGQLGAPPDLHSADPLAVDKDLTAVMSLPKLETETDSTPSAEATEPSDKTTDSPSASSPEPTPEHTLQSASISPYLHAPVPQADTPHPEPQRVPAPPEPPTDYQSDTPLTFAHLGIAEANPEPNELADSLARGDFKWPSMAGIQPAPEGNADDLLGQPLSSTPSSSERVANLPDSNDSAPARLNDFDSVISGCVESSTTRDDTADTADTADSLVDDFGDTGFNPFDYSETSPTAGRDTSEAKLTPKRRPILGTLTANTPAANAPAPPVPVPTPATKPSLSLPVDTATPLTPPATDAWVNNPPTLVPSSASSRILSESFTPDTSPDDPAESIPTQSSSADEPTRSTDPTADIHRAPRPSAPASPTSLAEPEISAPRDVPRRSRRPAIDPHLAEAEGKNELLAMIAQAEKLLAASGAAIIDATETLQEPSAQSDSQVSGKSALTPDYPDTAATPDGNSPGLPKRGKTPDQELLIARADAMLAQAGARSATLQDELRNLGRAPGSPTPIDQANLGTLATPDAPGLPDAPDTATAPTPGADAPDTTPLNWRNSSAKYPKGR